MEKKFMVFNRNTEESLVIKANSAQEACQAAGWPIGDCWVRECAAGIHGKIDLIGRSTTRLVMLEEEKTKDKYWWAIMRREAWLHLKRSWELWWMVLFRWK